VQIRETPRKKNVQQSACLFFFMKESMSIPLKAIIVLLKAGPTCKLSVTLRLHKHDNGMLTVSRIKKRHTKHMFQ
jgi:hypothetical protein